MIRFACLIINNSKIGFTSRISSTISATAGHHILSQRKFYEMSPQKNSDINPLIDEVNAINIGNQSSRIMQIDKEIGKMEIKMDELKNENAELVSKMMKTFEGMQTENEGLKEEYGKIKKELKEFKLANDEMKKELNVLKLVVAKKEKENEKLNKKTRGWGNRIRELANFVLANIALRKNKLNATDCGPNLGISMDGLVLEHKRSCSSSADDDFNSVRAISPIPLLNRSIEKSTIAFYYEMEILNSGIGDIIGFCDQHFPVEVKGKVLGEEENSIGFWRKEGIVIEKYRFAKFEDAGECKHFKKGDFAGIGIIHRPNSQMECFATLNGKLLGIAKMPEKFANVQLFPAIGLLFSGESIRVNFGKDKWSFEDFGLVLEKN